MIPMLQMDFAEVLLLAQQTINQPRDLFVAMVAIGLGLNIVYTAVYNSEKCFQLSTVQMMERNFGRENARFILIGLGSFCVVLGIYLIAQSASRRTVAQNLSEEREVDVPSQIELVNIR